MSEILLLQGNPSKRRRSGGRKRRSPAQRAATRRMLAANRSRFHSNPTKRRKKRRASVASAAPAVHRRRRSAKRSAHRRVSRRGGGSGLRLTGISGMVKNAAFAGGGALVVDVGMGLLGKAMPGSTFLSPLNADGSVNYMYYVARGGMIYALGKYGSRITRHAPVMAAGALAVMGYNIMRSFMPTDGSIPLGYFNPGRVVSGGQLGGVGRIMRNPGMGRIVQLPSTGKGSAVSTMLQNMRGVTASTMRAR